MHMGHFSSFLKKLNEINDWIVLNLFFEQYETKQKYALKNKKDRQVIFDPPIQIIMLIWMKMFIFVAIWSLCVFGAEGGRSQSLSISSSIDFFTLLHVCLV